eukprot:s2101_g8.t1
MVEPLAFPLKAEYERMNTTLEGMKERSLLDGDPNKRSVEDGDDDHDDDDQDDDSRGGPGPDRSKTSKKRKSEALPPEEKIFEDEPTLDELIAQQPDHWREGKACDGVVYLNDIGEREREPKATSPEEWAELSQVDRNAIKKIGKRKLEKKVAKEKEERIVKETKKKALADDKKSDKKKKKKDKKEKNESKVDDEENIEDIFEDAKGSS